MPPPSFTRINEIVSVQYAASKNATLPSSNPRTLQTGPNPADTPPETILFLSWADAPARHIEKYTTLYNEIYPTSTIILVEAGMAAFFLRPARARRALMEPVVRMLGDAADDALHVHVMSNAGAQQWCVLDRARSELAGRTLANSSTVIDSAPGRAHLKHTWAALSESLPKAAAPRLILSVVLGVSLCLLYASKHVWRGVDSLEKVRQQLNEQAPAGAGARRCYIYSDADRLVGWQDVQDHAEEAEQKGWCVEVIKWQGSLHVGHLKQNPQRYREAIERTWLGRSKL